MAEENKEIKNEVTEQVQNNKLVADFANGIYSSSDSFKLATSMGKALAGSTLIPIQYQNNLPNCMIALELSNRFDISPLMIMQNTHIIQGKPSFSSSFLIAMVNGSGKYDFELQFEERKDKDGNPFACKCWTEKDGRRVEGMEVNMDMAKAEGWLAKNGSKWKSLPSLMLRYRAAAFFVRTCCPELALGFYTKEEFEDNDFSNTSKKASLNDLLKDDAEVDVIEVEGAVVVDEA